MCLNDGNVRHVKSGWWVWICSSLSYSRGSLTVRDELAGRTPDVLDNLQIIFLRPAHTKVQSTSSLLQALYTCEWKVSVRVRRRIEDGVSHTARLIPAPDADLPHSTSWADLYIIVFSGLRSPSQCVPACYLFISKDSTHVVRKSSPTRSCQHNAAGERCRKLISRCHANRRHAAPVLDQLPWC